MPLPYTLTNKQYQVLLGLYNELPAEFARLSGEALTAFYLRLYKKD